MDVAELEVAARLPHSCLNYGQAGYGHQTFSIQVKLCESVTSCSLLVVQTSALLSPYPDIHPQAKTSVSCPNGATNNSCVNPQVLSAAYFAGGSTGVSKVLTLTRGSTGHAHMNK